MRFYCSTKITMKRWGFILVPFYFFAVALNNNLIGFNKVEIKRALSGYTELLCTHILHMKTCEPLPLWWRSVRFLALLLSELLSQCWKYYMEIFFILVEVLVDGLWCWLWSEGYHLLWKVSYFKASYTLPNSWVMVPHIDDCSTCALDNKRVGEHPAHYKIV